VPYRNEQREYCGSDDRVNYGIFKRGKLTPGLPPRPGVAYLQDGQTPDTSIENHRVAPHLQGSGGNRMSTSIGRKSEPTALFDRITFYCPRHTLEVRKSYLVCEPRRAHRTEEFMG
jgi:hypothetical protein